MAPANPPSMNIFRRPHYESDVTLFIEKLKKDKPSLEAEQRAGRALLWDKNVDRNLQAQFAEGRVEQQAYVYLTQPETV